MADTKNEVDITTDKFQCNPNDSCVDQFKLFTQTNLNKNSKPTISACVTNESGKETKITKSNFEAVDSEVGFTYRKLKEAETQVKSLTLILEQAGSGDRKDNGMDLEALEKNRTVLEAKIEELKKFISKKGLELRPQNNSQEMFTNVVSERSQKDEKTNEESSCLNETENGEISDKNRILNNGNLCFVDTKGITSKVNEWLEENDSILDKSECGLGDLEMIACDENSEYLRQDNARLRRRLSEARQKQKAERNRVIEQLRVLEIETVNGERNWASEVQEKQLKIEELLNKSQGLVVKNKKLTSKLTDCEKLRKKESIESEEKTKKKDEVISELKGKLSGVHVEKEKLEEGLKELERTLNETEVTVKQLEERQTELKQAEFCDKNQAIEKGNIKESEKYLNWEIKETRTELDNLLNEVSGLNKDKKNIEALTNGLENEKLKVMEMTNERKLLQKKSFIDVGSQTVEEFQKKDGLHNTKDNLENEVKINNELRSQLTEARDSCVKCWEEKQVENQNEVTELKMKLLQKESTIQELTISPGKSITKNDKLSQQTKSIFNQNSSKDETKATTMLTRRAPLTSVMEIMEKARTELAFIQEDITKHNGNVEMLGDKWRHYKNCMKEIHQNLLKKSFP